MYIPGSDWIRLDQTGSDWIRLHGHIHTYPKGRVHLGRIRRIRAVLNLIERVVSSCVSVDETLRMHRLIGVFSVRIRSKGSDAGHSLLQQRSFVQTSSKKGPSKETRVDLVFTRWRLITHWILGVVSNYLLTCKKGGKLKLTHSFHNKSGVPNVFVLIWQ